MNDFLSSLPRMSDPLLDHVIDLRDWEDPEALADLPSYEEMRDRSTDLYDYLDSPDEEALKKVIQLIVETARVGRVLTDSEQRWRLSKQIRFWQAHLNGFGIAVMAPGVFDI